MDASTDARRLLAGGFAAIREEFGVPASYPPPALAEADAAAVAEHHDDRLDARDLPFVTLDPAGSTDLDQAFAVSAEGDDIVLHYAIADVAAFVPRAGALATEVWHRGVTICTRPTAASRCTRQCSPRGRRPSSRAVIGSRSCSPS